MEKIVTFADVQKGDIVCKELADIVTTNYYRVNSVGRYSSDWGDFISLSLSFKNSQRTNGYNDVPTRRIVLVHRPQSETERSGTFLNIENAISAVTGRLVSIKFPEALRLLLEAIEAHELGKPLESNEKV